MKRRIDKASDTRFWECFVEAVQGLSLQAENLTLPTKWWHWSLARRAEHLLAQVRESQMPPRFESRIVQTIALQGLLISHQRPIDLRKTIKQRIGKLEKLVKKKGSDYNAGKISILEYWILGQTSIFHEIHKRALRLVSLGNSQRSPRFDSIGETGLDIAAFCLFLLAYKRGGFALWKSH